jgi:nitroreductase
MPCGSVEAFSLTLNTMTAASLLRARYGQPEFPDSDVCSPLIAQLLTHRTVRHHLPKPVSDAQLTAIVAAAQSAASSSNLQPWSVIAVREPATRARLAQLAGDQVHVQQAPLVLVWLADLARLEAVAHAEGLTHDALDYLEMALVGVIDAALAAQNAMVAAESLGLSGCYIGGLRNQPEAVAELLGLPSRVFAVFGMTLGKEDPAQQASIKPRLPQSAVLHHERYHPVAEQQADVATYNEAMAAFYAQQQMKVRGTWAVHSGKRVATPEALTGRDRLKEALQALGFPLK